MRVERCSYVTKPWGFEIWLVRTDLYALKQLHVAAGQETSVHRHSTKTETFCVERGVAMVLAGGKTHRLTVHDSLTITPGTEHQLRALPDSSVDVLEVATPAPDDDVIRISDRYADRRGKT